MGVRGGVWGKWQGARSTQGVAAALCLGITDDWNFSYFFFKFCIYQYFIIFPQWTILHQKFLRRKKLGRPKREVKTKSGRTWEEEVTSSVGGGVGVAWGQGRYRDEGTQIWPLQRTGLAKGLLEVGTGGQLRSPHISWALGLGGGAMKENSVCQVLF